MNDSERLSELLTKIQNAADSYDILADQCSDSGKHDEAEDWRIRASTYRKLASPYLSSETDD